MINWKVRIVNEKFWAALVPAIIVLIQSVAAVFGYTLDISEVGMMVVAVVDSVFVVLAILGIVNDPTTDGLRDSELAMTYETPKK